MAQEPASDQMAKQLREAWFRYLDTIEPIRPALYRYCRRITRDIWDAEDLLQETLLKGFGAIGRGDLCGEWCRVNDSRTYLFRVATNLWIDQVRRRELPSLNLPVLESPSEAHRSIETREAASVLLSRAAPQERAAVILKDVFDFTLEEIAVILMTTAGAVKSALHRGRAGLEEKRRLQAYRLSCTVEGSVGSLCSGLQRARRASRSQAPAGQHDVRGTRRGRRARQEGDLGKCPATRDGQSRARDVQGRVDGSLLDRRGFGPSFGMRGPF